MTNVTDLKVSFPIADLDLSDIDSIKKKMIAFIEDDNFSDALTEVSTQPPPAQEVAKPYKTTIECTIQTSGKGGCTIKYEF